MDTVTDMSEKFKSIYQCELQKKIYREMLTSLQKNNKETFLSNRGYEPTFYQYTMIIDNIDRANKRQLEDFDNIDCEKIYDNLFAGK